MIVEIIVLGLFVAAVLFVVVKNLHDKSTSYKDPKIPTGGGESINPDVEQTDKDYEHKK
jgi:hypothetical protein